MSNGSKRSFLIKDLLVDDPPANDDESSHYSDQRDEYIGKYFIFLSPSSCALSLSLSLSLFIYFFLSLRPLT